ncbi:MAG: phosphotransferase [Lachnospiraceae bacterium]|nr:phosphotransferase [Lachnospiraceae bacterium]
MKPRAVNVLERYDLEVLRTWRVRGAILCETDKGLFILKEYNGSAEKLLMQDAFLTFIRKQGFLQAEEFLKNEDGELLSRDVEGCGYIVKTYVEGRECSPVGVREVLSDGCAVMRTLAKLHKASFDFKEVYGAKPGQTSLLLKEFEKHNRELKKVQRFLKEKGQKSDFEHFLQQNYDIFLEQALTVTKQLKEEEVENGNVILCHGDFQYHNALFSEGNVWLMNFERCVWDDRTRDIYHFVRKMSEKNDWLPEMGKALLNAYEKELALTPVDGRQLYYRFSYPEKFWKIVNYYYNRGKAFIPDKNREKLEVLLEQEEKRNTFVENVIVKRFLV